MYRICTEGGDFPGIIVIALSLARFVERAISVNYLQINPICLILSTVAFTTRLVGVVSCGNLNNLYLSLLGFLLTKELINE